MCTVLLPPGVNTIAVNKYIILYHIIWYHIISYHIIQVNQPNGLQGVPGSEDALVSISLVVIFLWHSLFRFHVTIFGFRLICCLYEAVRIGLMYKVVQI